MLNAHAKAQTAMSCQSLHIVKSVDLYTCLDIHLPPPHMIGIAGAVPGFLERGFICIKGWGSLC